MSTYYAVVCEVHKERCDAVSVVGLTMATCPVGYSNLTLGPFLHRHAGCHLRIVSEHEPLYDADGYLDWDASNYSGLLEERP